MKFRIGDRLKMAGDRLATVVDQGRDKGLIFGPYYRLRWSNGETTKWLGESTVAFLTDYLIERPKETRSMPLELNGSIQLEHRNGKFLLAVNGVRMDNVVRYTIESGTPDEIPKVTVEFNVPLSRFASAPEVQLRYLITQTDSTGTTRYWAGGNLWVLRLQEAVQFRSFGLADYRRKSLGGWSNMAVETFRLSAEDLAPEASTR